jgi:hypothetical protein
MEGRAPSGPRTADPPASPQWRRPLIAALITVVLMTLVILIAYRHMRDDARSDAAGGGRAPSVKQAAASDRAGASAAQQRPRSAPAEAAQSR